MGYKILGFVVWRGSRWYLGRRYRGVGRNAAIGGAVAGTLVLGAVAAAAASRQRD